MLRQFINLPSLSITRRSFLLGLLVFTLTSCEKKKSDKEDNIKLKLGKVSEFTEPYNPLSIYRIAIIRKRIDAGIKLSAISIVCSHQNCILKPPNESGHFECPCHGSIFTESGAAIKGPATKSLEWKKIEIVNDELFLYPEEIVDENYGILLS